VEMHRILNRVIGEDIELTVELDPALGRIKADQGQIEQVILNLAVNARDAMPGGGNLYIRTANATRPGIDPAGVASASRRYALLEVRDTGTGMTPDVQSRMFEPFFTTKEKGKGTGLGLSTVYGIVEQSGGQIAVNSEPGGGATFQILLPITDDAETSSETPVIRPPSATGRERILLVEDEESVRRLVQRVLEKAGYSVLPAGGPMEALQICEHCNGPIDLILTDVVMPKLSGQELVLRLRQFQPTSKVLFMSGYIGDSSLDLTSKEFPDQIGFLQKPFTPAALVERVRRLLQRPGPAPGK
jgi:two-component system, cell cycle sensor histidine kinase and response regulator CckA